MPVAVVSLIIDPETPVGRTLMGEEAAVRDEDFAGRRLDYFLTGGGTGYLLGIDPRFAYV